MRISMSEFSNRARSASPLAFLTVFDLNSKQYKPPKDEMNRVDCCALPSISAMPAINVLACELLKTHVPGLELPNRRVA